MSTDAFMAASAKPTFERSTTALLGPADADHYRVKVGRYGDRWYCDPLPADDTWPAWDETAPSISTVKKASGSDWSFVSLKRVAVANPDVKDMTLEMRYATFNAINKTGLSAAGKRGTNIHLYAESKLHGNPVRIADGAPGHEWMPAVDAWFDQYQPELIAAEYVVIDRELHGIGYGGTPDGLLRIDGELYAIDWKSRGVDSDHGAYPEEAEQIAAGVVGQYMIVQGPNGPQRQPIPDVAGGLVISIRPDGCRTYPIDIDKAARQWWARHDWWVARRTERDPIGKQWAVRGTKPAPKIAQPAGDSPETTGDEPQAAPLLLGGGARTSRPASQQLRAPSTTAEASASQDTPTGPEMWAAYAGQTVAAERRKATVDNLRERCRTVAAMSPKGGEWLKAQMAAQGLNLYSPDTDLTAVVALIKQAEAAVSAPFNDEPPARDADATETPAPTPARIVREVDEGARLADTDAAVVRMKAAYADLDAASRSWLEGIVKESMTAGRSLHMGGGHTTMRRVRIITGLATLALSEQGEVAA